MSIRKRKAILARYNRKYGTTIETLPEIIEAVSPVKRVDAKSISLSATGILECADSRLFDYLSSKGVLLSTENKKALSTLNELLLAQLLGQHVSRHQVDLPAGFGKTSAIKCLVATVCELDLPNSLGISLERIDQIDELYDELIDEFGIPKEKLKRVHSGKSVEQTSDYYASLKDAQFLIFTQAKLKAAQFVDTYYMHRNPVTGKLEMRDLLIWDESLISSLSFSERYSSVVKMVSGAITDLEDSLRKTGTSPEVRRIREQIIGFLIEFRQFLDDHKGKDFSRPTILKVPVKRLARISPADINVLPVEDDRVKDILRIYSGDKASNFLRASTDTLNNKVALTFKEILPKELKNITVLDASASFRVATRLDKSFTFVDIKRDVSYPGSKAIIYDYNSGGTDIKGAFNGIREKRKNIGHNEYEKFAQDTAEQIFEADPDASVLLSSYKGNIGELERVVNVRLKASDNVDANRGHLMTITYGMETATNEYRDCEYIIEVGTFQTPDYAIDNLIAGQLGDRKYDQDKLEELRDIVALTEMIHTFYQRTFRIRIRLSDPAKPIVLYGFSKFREEIREILMPIMPGFIWDFSDAEDPFEDARKQRKEIKDREKGLGIVERRFLYDYGNLLVRKGQMTQKQIADALGLSVDTVKSNLQQWERRKKAEPYNLIGKDDSARPAQYYVRDAGKLREAQEQYEPEYSFGENGPEEAIG